MSLPLDIYVAIPNSYLDDKSIDLWRYVKPLIDQGLSERLREEQRKVTGQMKYQILEPEQWPEFIKELDSLSAYPLDQVIMRFIVETVPA